VQLGAISSGRLGSAGEGTRVVLCGLVTALREINTKSGTRMGFVTLEDVEGSVEVTVFPETFRQSAAHLRGGMPLLVRGKVETGTGGRKLLAEEIRPFPSETGGPVTEPPRHCVVRVRSGDDGTADLQALREILAAHPGSVPVDLVLEVDAVDVTIRSRLFRVAPAPALTDAVERLLGAGAIRLEA